MGRLRIRTNPVQLGRAKAGTELGKMKTTPNMKTTPKMKIIPKVKTTLKMKMPPKMKMTTK